MLNKNGGGDHKRRLSRVHYICTMHCVQCTLEKQCTAHHVIIVYNNRHTCFRAYPWGRDMKCFERINTVINVLTLQFRWMQYGAIINRVITRYNWALSSWKSEDVIQYQYDRFNLKDDNNVAFHFVYIYICKYLDISWYNDTSFLALLSHLKNALIFSFVLSFSINVALIQYIWYNIIHKWQPPPHENNR